jgi:hypothetical protein
MAAGAAKRIWANSRASNGSLIVLLAIADEIGEGEFTEMSIAGLARKARLSDKGTRRAVKDLEALGELSVESRRGGVSRYAPRLTPVKMTGPNPGQNDRPVKMSPRSKRPDPSKEPQVSETPVKMTGPEIPDVLDFGSVVSGERPKTKSTSETPRPDVDRLCEHLADRVAANVGTRPKIGQRWRTAARLMLDADGRTEEDAHKAIDWCQANHFWLKNVRSMEKLRQHYERLRLDAIDEQRKKARPSGNSHQPTTDDLEALRKNWAAPLDAMEAGNDPSGNDRPNRVHHGRLPSAED